MKAYALNRLCSFDRYVAYLFDRYLAQYEVWVTA
jgi:hypothetical protein